MLRSAVNIANLSNKAFVHVTTIDFLERSVVVFCGSLDELDKVVGKTSKFCNAKQADILKKDWKDIRTIFSDEFSKAQTLAGLTTGYGKQPDVCVWLLEWNSAVLVHELFHAVGMMCRSAGIEDEEAGAYMIGYLFKDIAWTEIQEKKGLNRR